MVQIKRVLGLSATQDGGMKIQRLDGGTPPQPQGPALLLTKDEWQRTQNLLLKDARVAQAAAEANAEGGGSDPSEVVWLP